VELLSWRSVKDLTGDGGVVKSITKEGDGFKKPKDRDEVLGARPPARERAARDALPAPQLTRQAAWVCARMRRGQRHGRARGGSMKAWLREIVHRGQWVQESMYACQQLCLHAVGTSEGIGVRAAAPACRQGPSPPAHAPWFEKLRSGAAVCAVRYAVREKGSDAVVASSPEGGAEFMLSDGHLLKVGRAAGGVNAERAQCLLPWLQQSGSGAQVAGNTHVSRSTL